MYNPIDIKKNDFVKYAKSIYLVKDFKNLNGRYRLSFYFRAIKKDKAKLHTNSFNEITGYSSETIKRATAEEIAFLTSKIKAKSPTFDTSFIKAEITTEKEGLNEEDCINFLKERGFIIYRQV